MQTPHSTTYEKSILSSIMQDLDDTGIDELTPEHFYLPAHRTIFNELMKSSSRDLVTFTQDLINKGILDKIGGPATLSEIYSYATTGGNFKHYVKEMHKLKARRHAIQSAHELIDAANDLTDDETFVTLSGANMTLVSDIASAASNARPKKIIISELLANLEKKIKGEISPMGWSTGINSMDKSIMGINTQRLHIISGFPTSGKTVLAIQICWKLALEQIPALIISLEMPDHKIAERNLIMASGLSAKAITNPIEYAKEDGKDKPTAIHIKKMQRGINTLMSNPIYFEDPTSANVNQIIAIIRRNVKDHGIKAVAVDYIQLIRGNTKTFSKEQEMAEISHAFQSLAKELGIAVILLSQQNKDGDTKHSQAIAEDADAIFTIVQKEDSQGVRQHIGIGVKKDRHNGNTGAFLPIKLNKEMLLFEEMSMEEINQSDFNYFT